MPPKRQKQAPAVPEWVVTFGDMMSLLLCFFILLQMFSELKRDHEYQHVITAVKEAFGYSGSIGVLPIDKPPLRSIIEQLEEVALEKREQRQRSDTPTESMEGEHLRVARIREGLVFTIGGPSTFDPESAEVKEPVRRDLAHLAELLVGRNNKIIVRGHAANKYLSPDSPWRDLRELSYARARNVMDILVDLGLEERLFRLEAAGRWEPVRERVIDPDKAAENRRVEVILTEIYVDDLNEDADSTDVVNAEGG